MVDYAMEVFQQLHGAKEAPEEMVKRRDQVMVRMGDIKDRAQPLLDVIEDSEVVDRLMSEGRYSWQGIKGEFQLSDQTLDAVADLAKFNYDCGAYKTAGEQLGLYLQLTGGATNTARGPSVLWGKLSCAILDTEAETALQLIREVKQIIDFKTSNPLEQLQQRSWLLHWSLFVFFTHANGRDELVTMFMEEKFMQAIQTNCPWMLRYLVTAVILTKSSASMQRRRYVMKDLIRVLGQEKANYSDPITSFMECLYVQFDFDGAMEMRKKCEEVLLADFFLCNVAEEFMEQARLFIFETYCRIHQKIEVDMLASKMGMEKEAAEKWIVDLIRGSQLDAKIDSRSSVIIMGSTFPSVYQQVIEKTKDLTVRSTLLINTMEQYAQDRANGLTSDPNYGMDRRGE
ncbi:unnamed protein product [Chrysoparadoxa australica]